MNEIWSTHVPNDQNLWCLKCESNWPCETIELANAYDALSGSLAERHNQWLDERRLRITYQVKTRELEERVRKLEGK